MPETAEPEMTARQAWATIDEAIRFEEGLRSRTEGLTWILWGLINAAIFLSYEAVATLYYGADAPLATTADPAQQRSPWWVGGLWVPWILVGAAATYALWKSAALSSRHVRDRPPRHALAVVAYVAFIFVGWAIALVALPDRAESVYPMLGLGTAWVVLAALDPYRATVTGRRVAGAVGVLIVAFGVVVALLVPPDLHNVSGLSAALVTGAVPLAAGLWQSLRG